MTASRPAAAGLGPAIEPTYRAAFDDLLQWMVAENFQGWDPYDGCNTQWEFLRRWRSTRLLLTYGNKFSPINFRPLLRIPKRDNYCALALTSRAVRRAFSRGEVDDLQESLARRILAGSLIDRWGEHCWNGNGLYIQSRADYQTPDVPGVIGTIFCAGALLARYRETRDSRLAEVVLSARRFLRNALLTWSGTRPFFRYKPISPEHELVFNASIKTAAFVLEVEREFGMEDDSLARACINHVVDYQRDDGAWLMLVDLRTGRQKAQIDFHQGFILDALLDSINLLGDSQRLRVAWQSGLAFYRKQFQPSGASYYRYPRTWPSNIHDQAQGIITFARAAALDPAAAADANRVAEWTLKNMRDPRGFFYFLHYPWFRNRVPYIRWSQAWMLYALTHMIGPMPRGTTRATR